MTTGGRTLEDLMRLLENVRAALPRLEILLAEADSLSGREASLGLITGVIISELRAFAPNRPLNGRFAETIEQIDQWAEGSIRSVVTARSVLNSFLQARFFLHLAVHLAKEAPRGPVLPSGATALLRLYET